MIRTAPGRERIAQPKCGIYDKTPFDTLAGIEIEHRRVRVLDVVDRRTPRIDLDYPNLDQAQ
jgi:hypothetical protein